MKLVQYIAQSTGMGRREAMDRIREGRVMLDGAEAPSASVEIDPGKSRVLVDGKLVVRRESMHLVLWKPRASVCTRSDPEGRATVYDLLKPPFRRVASVGRLDYNTTGVLLLTTDGELAQSLMKPSSGVPRVYRVRLRGPVTPEALEQMRHGVVLEGRLTRRADVRSIGKAPGGGLVEITLREGRNRQIHEMARAVGLVAVKIHRTSYGGVGLSGLRPGSYRKLLTAELHRLERFAR